MYCPALTDGSLGDMLYFHSFQNPGLIIDLVQDIRAINTSAVFARKTGVVILGGGVHKFHPQVDFFRAGGSFITNYRTRFKQPYFSLNIYPFSSF